MSEPDHIVLRPAPGLPAGFLPPRTDGLWIDRSDYRPGVVNGPATAIAVPTGRFETRDSDGAVAEVYEIRPVNPQDKL